MNLSLADLLRLARYTAQYPRKGARLVIDANLPLPARWFALALMAVLSAILAHVSIRLMPATVQMQLGEAMSSPIETAVVQGGLMAVTVLVIHWLGRWRGGTGTFADALILMVWLQFVLLILQVAQIVAEVILPPLSEVIGFASIGIFMWLISNFIAELHGFQSVLKVFAAVIATVFGFALIIAMLLLPLINGVA